MYPILPLKKMCLKYSRKRRSRGDVSRKVCSLRNGGLTLSAVQDNPDPTLFSTEIRNCAGTTISLGVFSAKVSSYLSFGWKFVLRYSERFHFNTRILDFLGEQKHAT